MNTEKLMTLLAQHQIRELPDNYTLLSPAAEVSALLKSHMREKAAWEQQLQKQEKEQEQLLADITTTVYFLDEAIKRHQPTLEETGQNRIHQELRILKDKLVESLQRAGYRWHDPMGELFEGELPHLVSVSGWRLSPDQSDIRVAQVREPVIYFNDSPVKEGNVIVAGPPPQNDENTRMPDEAM